MMQTEGGGDSNEDNAMTLLENIMQHLFQQAFYPVSKVSFVFQKSIVMYVHVFLIIIYYHFTCVELTTCIKYFFICIKTRRQ